MAEELDNTGAGENSTEQNLQTLDALHLDGKGAPTLEDADERSLNDLGDTRPEDVTGNANVQSAGRSTFEQMVEGGIREQPVVPTADHLALDTVQPTFRDHDVDARFDNVQPRFNTAGDLAEPERREPERDDSTTAPDTLVSRDPVTFPRGDGDDEGADTVTGTQAAAVSPPPAEESAPESTRDPAPPQLPDDEIVEPKVADAPSVLVSAASGTEDTDTKLDIHVATADRDGGSETISNIIIANVPAGFSFVDGAGNPVGIQTGSGWSFTLAQLDNLYLRQPGDYSGDITLLVTATSQESNGSTATTTMTLGVHVEAVADAPDVAGVASGTEDQLIPLTITVGNNDAVLEGVGANAPETISAITISNVPAGFSFVTAAGVPAGVDNGNGTWSFTPADLADLHLKQPGNYSGDLTLTVSATSREANGSTAATTTTMAVHVEAVADAPDLTAAASGTEDQLIPLTITVGSNDAVLEGVGANAPETISVITISNVPAGFSFATAAGAPTGVNNGNGTWSFTPADLADLHLKQPGNYSGDLTLTVSATSREANGSTATTTTTMAVHVEAVADAPGLSVADSAGMENALIPLSITVGNNDAVLESTGAYAPETQTVYISNLPAGATLYIGDAAHPVTAQVGGVGLTIDGTTIPAGAYVVSAADLPNLKVQSPSNDSHDFTLNVWATSTEPSNGDVAITGFQTIQVDVGVNAPSASGSGTGQEGGWADLTLAASVNFPDGTENLRVFIADLEPGAVLAYGDGTPVPVGADGRYEVTGHLNDLKVGWPGAHEDKDIDFNLVAEVRDGDTDADSVAVRAAAPDFAATTVPVTVTIQAVADGPSTLSASGIGVEDKWFALNVTTGLIDTDGSETLTVTISGPAGFQLAASSDTAHPYAGVLSEDGTTVTYTLTPAQLQNLQMRAAADSDTDVDLHITATTRETAAGAGQIALETKSTSIDLNVRILSDADKPVVSVIKDTQTIQEDGWFNLSQSLSGTFNDGSQDSTGTHAALSGASGEGGSQTGTVDSADHSETLTYRIKPVESGSRLAIDVNGDNQINAADLSAGDTYWNAAGGYWEVPAALVNDNKVWVAGKADWASAGSDRLHFDIQTVATETRDAGEAAPDGMTRQQTQVSDVATLTLKVDPVADVATAQLSVVASGYEDGLSGYDHTANATGSGIAVVPTLTLTDADLSESPTGVVTITSSDAAMLAGSLTITGADIVRVDGVDADGNPTATWTITGGDFTTTADNTFRLDGLVFHPAADTDADPVYDISVQFQDTNGGDVATVSATGQTIAVAAVADAPTLLTHAAGGTESVSGPALIDLKIDSALTDTDTSETLSVYVTGIPAGAASLSSYRQVITGDVTIGGVTIHGTAGNPVYVLSADDLTGLKLQVAQGYSEDMQLTVYSASTESDGGDVAVSGPATLDVDIGVLAPTITGAGSLSGDEDGYISLATLATSRQAGDATDSLSVYVEGLDSGATLYKLVDGAYVALPPTTYQDASGVSRTGYDVTALRDGSGALSGVYVKWDAAHKADDIHLTLRSVVADTDHDASADAGGFDRNTPYGSPYNDISESTEAVTVTVRANADAPATLTASAIGVEDKWVALNIASTLADTDGSETLTITVAGVPAGVMLSAGTIVATAADGTTTWSIGPAADNAEMQGLLSGLRMNNLPADSDADFDIVVRATTAERETGDQVGTPSAYSEITVNVKVLSDADKPVVSVIKDTQTIQEDGWFNLSQSLSGTFNDGSQDSTGTHAALSGASGEGGSQTGTVDSADHSETLTYRIKPVESGSRLAIDVNGDNQINAADLSAGDTYWNAAGGYWEVPAALVNGNRVWVAGKADWASAGSDRLHFDIQTVATETRDAGEAAPDGMTRQQTQVSDVATLTLKVDPVADGAVVTAVNSGYEDQAGGITVSPVLTLSDTDFSERPVGTVSFSSTDLDLAGGHFTLTLNGTTTTITPDFTDGVYTWQVPATAFTASGNTWTLSGLKYFPKAELAKDVTYTVTVDTQDSTGGDIRTLPAATGTIAVIAVADKPGVQTADYQGVESATPQDIPLTITPVASSDTDGSESMFVYITGIPSGKGSLVLANGSTVSATSATGITVDGVAIGASGEAVYKVAQADLAGLKLRVVGNYSDDMVLKVWSVTEENQYVAGQTPPSRPGDPDLFHAVSDPQTIRIDLGVLAPVTTVGTLSGDENQFIALTNITTTVTAKDGSETVKVFIEELSDGAHLFKVVNGNYVALTPTTYYDAQGNAHTGYDVSGLRNSSTGALNGVYASWNNSAADTSNSDANIDFKVRTVVWDRDIDTDPTRSSTNVNTTDSAADAGGLHLESYYGVGPWRDVNETVQSATVVVRADADPATLGGSAVAVEDKWVNLNLSAALNDTDGSENLTVTIAGVPAGLTLTANGVAATGAPAGDGTTTYTIGPCATNAEMQAALSGLKLTGLDQGAWANTDGSFNLTVTAITTESAIGSEVAHKTATVTKTVTVDVLSNADTPVVQVESAPQTIAEDAFFSLHTRIGDHFAVEGKSGEAGSLYGADASADGSETLSFRIKPVEAGSRLAIDVNGDGQISDGDLTEAAKYWNATGGYWEVPAALVNGNKVWVGGAANWSSTSDSDTLHFDIRTVATETRDGSVAGPADMPRQGVAVSDPLLLTLNVTPVADSTSITLAGSGIEDQAGGIPLTPTIRLADTDGSEQPSGTVDILVRCDSHGAFPGDIAFARDGVMVDGGVETYEGVTYHVFKVPATELTGSASGGYTLSGLTFVPDAHSDLDIQYRVRVTTTEGANSSSYVTVSSLANLDVAAVADAPALTVGKAAAGTSTVVGLEDSVIRLDLAAERLDLDGSEVLTNAELRNVPEGWGVVTVDANGNRLSSLVGTDSDGDGKYTFVLDPRSVTPGSGIFVALVPPANSDVDATGITFWAKVTEVTGADNPHDPDPSDNQVSVPTAEHSVTFNVRLDPVADTPVLQVTSARGNEDASIPLDIRTSVTDSDETALVEITGVPNGGVLTYVGADGQTHSVTFGNGVTALTVTPAEARTLRFTAPEDASGKFTLTVRSISTDMDTENPGLSHSTDRTATLDVTVKGVNDDIIDQNGHVVNATSGNLSAIGTEDANGNLVNLGLGDYSIADIDHSEALSAVIQGLPAGVALVIKIGDTEVDTADYLQYIGKDAQNQPIWSVPPQYMEYVHVRVPANYAGSFDLKVRLIATEGDGAAASFDKAMTVTVKPDADKPSGWVTGTYDEDGWGADGGIAFGLNARAADLDLHSVLGDGTIEKISGLEATLDVDSLVDRLIAKLGAGEELDTSGIYVVRGGNRYDVEAVQTGGETHYVIRLTGLSVTAGTNVDLSGFTLYGVPKDWSHDVPVKLSVTVADDTGNDGVDADVATFTFNSGITLNPKADTPELTFASSDPDHLYAAAAGSNTITIIADHGVRTTDADGSESFHLVIREVPNGVRVEGGTNVGGGTWVLPTGVSKVVLQNYSNGSAEPLTLKITTVVTDTDQNDGHKVQASFESEVRVDYGPLGRNPAANPPTPPTDPEDPSVRFGPVLEMSATVEAGSLTCQEDSGLRLNGLRITLTDQGDDHHALTLKPDGRVYTPDADDGVAEVVGTVNLIVKLPEGWTLSGGSYLIDAGERLYSIPYGNIGGVSLVPPRDYAGGDFTLDVRAMVTNNDGWYDVAGTGMTEMPITVTALADGASILVQADAAAEDAAAIPITLTIADKEIANFSETLATGVVKVSIDEVQGVDGQSHAPGTLKLGPLPDGSEVLADPDNPGGYIIVLAPGRLEDFATGDHGFTLTGLAFVPDRNFSGSVRIGFSASVADGSDVNSAVSSVTFTVAPVIDATAYPNPAAHGAEDTPIALNLVIAHEDLAGTGHWGSETFSVVISGVPAGARIEGAYNNGPTTVNGVTTYSWTVDRSSAHMVITDQGITLKDVNYVSPPDDSSDVALTITTYVFEKGVAEPKSFSSTVTVGVDGVTDGATLNPNNASGLEDQLVAMDLGGQLVDITGSSEVTTITISGVPVGASLRDADGNEVGAAGAVDAETGTRTWTLSTAEVASLDLLDGGKVYFLAAPNVSGSWTLTAQAFTQDIDGTTGSVVASNTLPFTVTVDAVADAPDLTVDPAVELDEDGQVSLGLHAELVDTDSESLTVTITGAPDGSLIRVNTGTEEAPAWTDIHGQDGVWTVPAGTALSLDNVFVKPPADYNGSFTLSVTASSTEQTGGSATTAAQTVAVTVNAVNDAPTAHLVSGGVGIEAGTHDTAIMLLGSDDSVTFDDVDFHAAGATVLLSKMTVSISGGSGLSADDALGLAGVPVTLAADGTLVTRPDADTTVTIAYDPATHTLTFSGNATAAQYAALAQHVVISSTSGTLTAGTREVTIAGYDLDGVQSAATSAGGVTVTVNGAATLTGAALGDVAFSAGGAPVLPPGSIATVEDAAPVAFNLGMASAAAAAVAVTIAGMPAGMVLRDANGAVVDTATLTVGQLPGLKVDLPENWNGSATLTVSANANGTVMTETVTLTATAVNDAPTTSAVVLAGTAEDGSFTFTKAQLLANAADVDGDSLSVSALSALHGSITDNGNNTYTYTPAANYHGADAITYTIGDGHGGTVTGTADFTVTSVNDAPLLSIDHTSQTVTGTAGVVSAPVHVMPHDANVGISDVDGTVISGMTVQLLPDAGGHYAVGDTLGLYGHDIALNQSCQLVVKDTNILVSYDATNHTLSFSGDGSYTAYADLAKSVVLSNTGSSLPTGTRSFSVTMYDDGNAASQTVTTSVDVSNGTDLSVTLSQDAHGTIYWNGSTPVLNGTGGDDSFQVHVGTDWSVNGAGGNDTLMLDCQNGGWTFALNETDHLVHVTSTTDPSHTGILHLDPGAEVQPFANGSHDIVFNGSASGTIDFGADHTVTFSNLEKVHG